MLLDVIILILQLVILMFQIIQLRNQVKLHRFIGMPKINVKDELKRILSGIVKMFKRN